MNLPEGSRILAIGQTPVQNYGDMQRALVEAISSADAGQQPVSVDVKYQVNITGQPVYTRSITIDAPWRERIVQAGWTMPNNSLPFAMLRQPVIAENAWAAAKLGVKKTHIFMMQTYLTLVRLIQQTVPFSSMTGPAGIVHAGTRIARESGWAYVVFFFGIISVNLVVINLLPIPIADGGCCCFWPSKKSREARFTLRFSPGPPTLVWL
ncbi:MAG: hypothetical protein HC898_10520 [Phycisphaerales bacterium]|nr:hypothetical protein [Phycisphaerales bacterium]